MLAELLLIFGATPDQAQTLAGSVPGVISLIVGFIFGKGAQNSVNALKRSADMLASRKPIMAMIKGFAEADHTRR